ncbi:MAG: cytochrome C oxidase subunit IV family protein [Candidatus Sumerlaeaceae bacterium]|jgi:cytochrome c oxidase subunit 4
MNRIMFDHIVPVRVYFLVFLALIVLTAVTVQVAFIDLGLLNTPIAILIASLKATLVVLYFMHVRYSEKLILLVVFVSVFTLMLLFAFALGDYLTRYWILLPIR